MKSLGMTITINVFEQCFSVTLLNWFLWKHLCRNTVIRFGFRYEKETNCPYKQKSLNVSTPFVLMTRLSLPLSKLIVDGDDNSFFSQGTLCSSLCSSAPKWWPSTMSELSLGIRTSVRRDLESSLSRYKKKNEDFVDCVMLLEYFLRWPRRVTHAN